MCSLGLPPGEYLVEAAVIVRWTPSLTPVWTCVVELLTAWREGIERGSQGAVVLTGAGSTTPIHGLLSRSADVLSASTTPSPPSLSTLSLHVLLARFYTLTNRRVEPRQ